MRTTRILTLLSLLLAIATHNARADDADTCVKYNYKCATENSECGGDFMTQESKCYNETTSKRTGSCCQFPYHCINKKCVLDNAGAECTNNNDCLSSYYGVGLFCVRNDPTDEKGKCAYKYSAGDKCSKDVDCYGTMSCDKGVCKGAVEGEACTEPSKVGTEVLSSVVGFECVTGTYCSNGTCTKKAAEGEACSDDLDDYNPCSEDLACNNEVCVKKYSVKTDNACAGNVCLNGKCEVAVGYHFMKCNNDSDCKVGNVHGVCSPCNHHTGHRQCYFGESTDCAKARKNYYDCIEKNKCTDVISLDSKSCAHTKCSGQINAFLGCKMNCKDYRNVYGTCASYKLIGYCPVMEKWAQTLLAFSILIVVLALVCVGYTMIERFSNKNGYTELPQEPDH